MTKYNNFLSEKDLQKLADEKSKFRVKCKCGHTNTIINPRGYKICSWCHNYVFLTPAKEFEYKMKQNLIKERRRLKDEYGI